MSRRINLNVNLNFYSLGVRMSAKRHESTIDAFFALVRTGLWADVESTDIRNLGFTESIDWDEVYQIAEEQSVIGVVLAGIEHSNVKPPQELLLQWIGEVQMLEQQNKSMNLFIADLVEWLRKADIHTLLVKGQGIAQCYESPLWRSSGDIDLLLDDNNYIKAQKYFSILASNSIGELKEEKHQEFEIGPWIVEIHGNMPTYFSKRTDEMLEKIKTNAFKNGYYRYWKFNDTEIKLLGIDADVLFVFTHILKHFFRGGIGLRQICDWCRLLWTYRSEIDRNLLEERVKAMGLMTEWMSFAALAVNKLGYPADDMPLYSDKVKWIRKSYRIMDFILRTGNFGHNRDSSYYKKYPFIVTKILSFYWRFADNFRYALIFPLDSIRVTMWMLRHGFNDLKRTNWMKSPIA